MLGLLVIHYKTIQRNNNNKFVQSFYEKFKQCKISFYSINFALIRLKCRLNMLQLFCRKLKKFKIMDTIFMPYTGYVLNVAPEKEFPWLF